jgi:hypothetical protein
MKLYILILGRVGFNNLLYEFVIILSDIENNNKDIKIDARVSNFS